MWPAQHLTNSLQIERAYFNAKRLHEENTTALYGSQVRNVKFRMGLAVQYPHS
jgi:hypothetical protein